MPSNTQIFQYNTDVLMVLRGFAAAPGETARYFLGIELEVNVPDCESQQDAVNVAARRDLHAAAPENYLIFKHDGSIPHTGWEIVTIPATFEYHKQAWTRIFEQFNPEERLVSWNTNMCGMHIHIGRDKLTPMQLTKLNVFINSPKNRQQLVRFSGRATDQLTQWANLKSDASVVDWLRDPGRLANPRKYSAMRTNKGPTIELRFFRGTVQKIGFMRNLEFCDALLAFTEKAGLNHMTNEHFNRFVYNQSVRWPNLYRWLVVNNYVESNLPEDELAQLKDMIEIYNGGI